MQVFTLTVLRAQSAQVPVLAKNVTLDHGEDCPNQDSAHVFPVPKGQGWQMCFIAHPYHRSNSRSSISAASVEAPSAAAPSIAAAATTTASSTDQLRQCGRKEWSHVPPTL